MEWCPSPRRGNQRSPSIHSKSRQGWENITVRSLGEGFTSCGSHRDPPPRCWCQGRLQRQNCLGASFSSRLLQIWSSPRESLQDQACWFSREDTALWVDRTAMGSLAPECPCAAQMSTEVRLSKQPQWTGLSMFQIWSYQHGTFILFVYYMCTA